MAGFLSGVGFVLNRTARQEGSRVKSDAAALHPADAPLSDHEPPRRFVATYVGQDIRRRCQVFR